MAIAVCDDNLKELTIIKSFLVEYHTPSGETVLSDSFQTAAELLTALNVKKYDALLMDIIMPGTAGMEVAREIRNNGNQIPIIFLTSSPEYAVESYRIKALDYLLKPIDKKLLFAALDTICSQLSSPNDSLAIKTSKAMLLLPFAQIEAVEINNKTLQFHLTNGTVKSITGKLSDYEEALLCREEFIKVHRSYIINMSLMKSFSNHSFVSLSDVTIPISRNLQKQVKETYMSFLRAVIK